MSTRPLSKTDLRNLIRDDNAPHWYSGPETAGEHAARAFERQLSHAMGVGAFVGARHSFRTFDVEMLLTAEDSNVKGVIEKYLLFYARTERRMRRFSRVMGKLARDIGLHLGGTLDKLSRDDDDESATRMDQLLSMLKIVNENKTEVQAMYLLQYCPAGWETLLQCWDDTPSASRTDMDSYQKLKEKLTTRRRKRDVATQTGGDRDRDRDRDRDGDGASIDGDSDRDRDGDGDGDGDGASIDGASIDGASIDGDSDGDSDGSGGDSASIDGAIRSWQSDPQADSQPEPHAETGGPKGLKGNHTRDSEAIASSAKIVLAPDTPHGSPTGPPATKPHQRKRLQPHQRKRLQPHQRKRRQPLNIACRPARKGHGKAGSKTGAVSSMDLAHQVATAAKKRMRKQQTSSRP
jgi:hypothetical protein